MSLSNHHSFDIFLCKLLTGILLPQWLIVQFSSFTILSYYYQFKQIFKTKFDLRTDVAIL